jgi:beta-aspartyl-peptidase (threonine type)
MGTVGAVALDNEGNLAAGTSTGGTPRKLPGRVGDSPVIGSGAYADNQLGAVSASGYGEAIMKVVLSKYVCDLFRSEPAKKACREAVHFLQNKVDGLGGVIGLTYQGEYAWAHNTPYMAFAWYDPDKGTTAKIAADS